MIKLEERYPGAMNDMLYGRVRQVKHREKTKPSKLDFQDGSFKVWEDDWTLHAEVGDPHGKHPNDKKGIKGAAFEADRNGFSFKIRFRL